MNRKYFYIAIGLSLFFLSCKEELQPQESSAAVRADQNQATANQKPAITQNTAQQAQTAQQTQANPTNTSTQAQGALNPAHGQPGHRCDIAVGAPLNSKPTQAPASGNKTITTQNIQATPQAVTTPVKTAKGMNPPHGQPGHRCDIAVGAPLNSKPTKTTATTTNSNAYSVTPTNTSAGTPSLLTPPTTAAAPAVETQPGMNPPHGQPGHVCGIAVGAPLNSEKKEEKKSQ